MNGNDSYLSLASKTNYLNKGIKYIKNTTITEYDIEAAGVNILTDLGHISTDTREKLLQLPKMDRNIYVGKLLQKDKNLVTALEEGFIEARYTFLSQNQLDSADVLSIKKDAFFILGQRVIDPQIGTYTKVRQANKYTAYINLLNREHYYNSDADVLDVKGYSKQTTSNMEVSLFKEMKKVLKSDILKDKESIFIDLIQLKDNLLAGTLPKEYYYDPLLDGYVIAGKYTSYIMPNVTDADIESLSYANTLRFIDELISYTL